MAKQRNGLEDMSFEQKDLHAEVAKQKKLVFEQGDAKVMFNYFKRMLEDNDKFFHTYRVDEDGWLKDVLWVDARSRAAYEEFGDVVVFDSTYLTNEYKLPFCNFVGVNHHGQTILLGCALVSRETAETFEWVFSSWLRCMGDKSPIGILTDQDPAMKKALKAVMKGTKHRWCIWHILNKFSQKLSKRIYYPELKEGLHRAVYNSLDWLFERAMWVPAFVKHLFWAGMKTTQRVESIHSFFDGYLSKHTLLHEFVERYEEALSIYTDAKFKEVQRECTRMMYVSGIERRQVFEQKEIPSKRKRRYVVTFDIVTKDASCECKHFDCHGIICRHIIKVYELHDHLDIPEKFILKRWRKDVIRSYTRVKVGYHDPSKTEEVCRFDKMMVKFNCVCSKSSFRKETTKLVLDTLQLLEIQVNEMVDMINKKAEYNGG
ncbi:protein FAR-RED IMPAIRED RESPONSE 1-like [Chenopodium quinoa]|uniref:protein FAR-RED IMPAIRED RESPONSE 1-like n=1 Tax=Chenopodium quinoa TaxID=63459 RepID=UPI000B7868D8|nr:protein FAR-RED IMPAIRED RESPONSE 1-like [Chenopodium quinoa]